MTNKPEGQKIQDEYERLAREQMILDDNWRLESVAAAIPMGIDDEIDRINADMNLTHDERWWELLDYEAPLAWLPQGIVLVTMVNHATEASGQKLRKAGFIETKILSEKK